MIPRDLTDYDVYLFKSKIAGIMKMMNEMHIVVKKTGKPIIIASQTEGLTYGEMIK